MMRPDVVLLTAYAGYLIWLGAGLLDFLCHRRTDLPHTSGVIESVLHCVQLGLIGIGMLMALAFEVGGLLVLAMASLVAAHAAAGYLDTRQAFNRRVILPAEQHLHSVLDMAPAMALAGLVIATWPAAVAPGWTLVPRQPAFGLWLWTAVLVPAVLLCAWPALLELRAAVRSVRGRA